MTSNSDEASRGVTGVPLQRRAALLFLSPPQLRTAPVPRTLRLWSSPPTAGPHVGLAPRGTPAVTSPPAPTRLRPSVYPVRRSGVCFQTGCPGHANKHCLRMFIFLKGTRLLRCKPRCIGKLFNPECGGSERALGFTWQSPMNLKVTHALWCRGFVFCFFFSFQI